MNILDEIVAHKRKETEERRSLYPVKLLERSIYFETQVVSLRKYLRREELSGIIAEFKRRSPSKGMLNEFAAVEKTTIAYMQAGASALSVLTDAKFFGGSSRDLETARRFNYCPILRKDFVIDEYQVIEARSIGADAVLLIAEALTEEEVKNLSALAASLGMEVLLEIHDRSQLGKISEHVHLLGVNNRDLQTFEVRVERSLELAAEIPSHLVKISESGLSSAETILLLRAAGFQGFLIGENFMRAANPGKACAQLIAGLKRTNEKTVAV